jgi:glycerol uptake facilitator-like aquaporin
MRKALAEFVGIATLAAVVIGSGMMAESLTSDVALRLFFNVAVIALALWLLITLFSPISGAHFNPLVTGLAYFRKEISLNPSLQYVAAQFLGAITGTIIANYFFQYPAIYISHKNRDGGSLLVSEAIATAGLIFVIYQLSTIKKGKLVASGVAVWIFAAALFTPSTAFANPAISIGRIFSNTFAGIAPHSAFAFIPVEILGAIAGYALFKIFNKKEKK